MEEAAAFAAVFFAAWDMQRKYGILHCAQDDGVGQAKAWNKQRPIQGSFTTFRMTTSKGERHRWMDCLRNVQDDDLEGGEASMDGLFAKTEQITT